MIIIVIGGIGSGKTLSIVKTIIDRGKINYPLTNFRLKNTKYHRLKLSDIINKNEHGKIDVNWEFWEKIRTENPEYSIYLDEAHNVIGSRSSMSKLNQVLSKWVSQIRKILADSDRNHLYIITQKPRRIDINFRELAQVVIECFAHKTKKNMYVLRYYYDGFDAYERGKRKAKSVFVGNKYFKYYDTTEMVTFKDGEEFL